MSVLFLPFPPSVNHYWRHILMAPRGVHPTSGHIRAIISERGREYRKQVIDAVRKQCGGSPVKVTKPIWVHIYACRPDRRSRDLDNYYKAPLDACTHADVWEDDSQIQHLAIEWCGPAAKSWHVPATTYELQPGLIALEIIPVP